MLGSLCNPVMMFLHPHESAKKEYHDENFPDLTTQNIKSKIVCNFRFLAAKGSSSRLCNVWCVCVCPSQSSHTCPEALIKLSELVNKYLLQFCHIL